MPTPSQNSRNTARPTLAPGVKRFQMTVTGPAKGPKPITFTVDARDLKEASLQVRKLIAVGRLTGEEA